MYVIGPNSEHMHLSFKSVGNKEHKGVICYMTSSSNSSQSTRPTGRVLWEELLVLIRSGRVEFLSPDTVSEQSLIVYILFCKVMTLEVGRERII